MNTRFRGNCTETVFFAVNGSTDKDTAGQILGASSYKEKVDALPVHAYLKLTEGKVVEGKNQLKKG